MIAETLVVPEFVYRTVFVVPTKPDGDQRGFADFARAHFYQVHKLLCMGYPDREAAKAARILFRFDEEDELGCLLVQSLSEPDYSRLLPQLEKEGISVQGPERVPVPRYEPGTRLRFRLLAKPAKRTGAKGNPRKKRVTLRSEAEQLAWLERKGEENGFSVVQALVTDRIWHDDKDARNRDKALHATQFDGFLRVRDAQALRRALAFGIGSQKAYGFGLLSVRRAE